MGFDIVSKFKRKSASLSKDPLSHLQICPGFPDKMNRPLPRRKPPSSTSPYDLVTISHLVSSSSSSSSSSSDNFYSSRYVQVFGLLVGRKENPTLYKNDPLILIPLPSISSSSSNEQTGTRQVDSIPSSASEKILIYTDSLSLSMITSLVKLGMNVPLHVSGCVRPSNERTYPEEVEVDAYFVRPAEELADATKAAEFEAALGAREDFFKDLIGKRNPL